ncbi:hypothetical protein EVAR_91130_1 [Eumeta japonica]|uniref:DUF4780 domain-containing protein n=1 Tax=Eumeta variegata TaxID=151549 RepID=A0A4C1SFE1_EUMVA|nr:hypothetical protein EVAR_91130_1 [Eumeta japonica]
MGLINQRLLDSYLKATADSTCPPPQCTDAGWFQGRVKLLSCADERSASALKDVFASLGEVWPGARLGLVSVDDIPRRPRAAAMVPAEPHEPEAILRILQRANPGLPTQDWRVVSVSEVQGFRRKVVVVLNRESLPALRIRRGMIFLWIHGDQAVSVPGRRQTRPQAIECSRHALPKYCNSNAASCRRRRGRQSGLRHVGGFPIGSISDWEGSSMGWTSWMMMMMMFFWSLIRRTPPSSITIPTLQIDEGSTN